MTTVNKTVKGLLGKKLGMTQVWDDQNRLIPVTVIEAGSNVVTQIKNVETDGYEAIQIAYGAIKPTKVSQPLTGHFKKAGVNPRRFLAEIRTADAASYAVGQGLCWSHEAPRLCRCKRLARSAPQPPQARFDRYVFDSGSCLQGHAHGWSYGSHSGHHS